MTYAGNTLAAEAAGLAPPSQLPPSRLPLSALLALAVAGFITILTEALPAGLLPQIAAGLAVPEALAGQLVTLYAVGSLAAAIPLTLATRGLRRRPLLLAAIAGFAVANTVTALSGHYVLTLIARLLAGVAAGLLWALIAGYAARMVPEHLKGRAIALAMVGTPLALSLGVPAGTFLGALAGWRACFGLMTGMTLLLMLWVLRTVPDFPGQAADRRQPLLRVLALPGIRTVLLATLGFVLAHNILYTYIAPFLREAQLGDRVDLVLLVFGAASLLGIWITGVLIDRWLRQLMLASTLLFGLAVLALGLWSGRPAAVYAAIGLWGLAFGGSATLLQTALAKAAGEASDLAQSMLVTAWNLAIAGGGLLGGLLLEELGVTAFAPALLLLLGATWGLVWRARAAGFPPAGGEHRA
ncbi:MFS transporter [Azoarcus indigens]|uniref:Putative MFS family arabinose efflux permease n=1 Tax=Azoarcus indigens TaxID=29545 RepID=A0A4V3BMN5_9RHOO|nr:MFS transporter [Azoarcus indigens]NMG64793.1 MFS transporter [Azoarcus indigens]TDN50822.1 putative MFS family arabinose efflux permease [Azoarcus indigens]